MRTSLLLLLLCTTIGMGACARQKKTAVSTSATTTTNRTSPTKAAPPITMMTMRRGGCFGRCAIYEVHLLADGTVRYVGEMFTPNLGTFEKNAGVAKTGELLRRAENMRVDTLKSEYELMIADLPGISFTFTRGGTVQKVNNAHEGPRFLRTLAQDMDSLAQVNGTWRKTAEVKKQN